MLLKYSEKSQTVVSENRPLRYTTGSGLSKLGSVQRRTARTDEKVQVIDQLVTSGDYEYRIVVLNERPRHLHPYSIRPGRELDL